MHLQAALNESAGPAQKLPLLWHWRPHVHDVDVEVPEDQYHYWEHLPILPIVATLILTLTVFLLLIFQRNPSLVAGIVAAGLGAIAVYLFLSNVHEHRLRFE